MAAFTADVHNPLPADSHEFGKAAGDFITIDVAPKGDKDKGYVTMFFAKGWKGWDEFVAAVERLRNA